MEKKNEAFNYEALRKKTIEQLRSGTPLFGKGGALAPMLKDFLEAALEAEIEAHLDDEQRVQGNRKNGYNKKLLKTNEGSFELATPGIGVAILSRKQYVNEKRFSRKFREKNNRYVWFGGEL